MTRPNDAKSDARAATSAATVPVEVLLALAIRHVNAGQPERARVLCDQAVASDAPHPAVQQLLAVLSLQSGDAASACNHAEASLALRPGHAPTIAIAGDAWFQRSLALHDQHDLTGAADALHRVLQRNPSRAEAEVNLGIVLQEAGRIDDAMLAYGRAYRLRTETFGRIAHALANASAGRLWLDLDALRSALGRAAA